jgi:diacylglycerol kinase family enzyme
VTAGPWLAIVNPHAGGRRAVSPRLLAALRSRADRVVVTESAGHAAAVAATARAYPGLLVAGGDGTVLEVLQWIDRSRQQVTIVPSGRGNSLARDLDASPRWIDLIEVSYRDVAGRERHLLAASTVAIGYPVIVAERANSSLRRLRRGSYAVAASVTRPVPFASTVAYDDGEPVAARLTGWIATNTRHLANFLAVPRASCADGSIETLELRAGFIGQTLHNLSALARLRREPVRPVPARSARVISDRPQTLLVDGELFPDVVAVNVRVMPGAAHCARWS